MRQDTERHYIGAWVPKFQHRQLQELAKRNGYGSVSAEIRKAVAQHIAIFLPPADTNVSKGGTNVPE